MTNTASDFGRELDSLADVITFGVAPAVLAWMWGFHLLPLATNENVSFWLEIHSSNAHAKLVEAGIIASFVFLVAGASRLARFNITKNPQPSNPGRPGKKYFVGMPIPAGAGVIAATVHLASGHPINYWWLALVWTALLVIVAFLMVSTWRFYSFKELNLRSRHPFQLMVLLGGVIYLIVLFSGPVLFAIAITYMLSGVLSFVFRRRPSQPAPPPLEEAPQPR
jgi:CDP-diacylglycerol--serine O-phosphatidyltransferase